MQGVETSFPLSSSVVSPSAFNPRSTPPLRRPPNSPPADLVRRSSPPSRPLRRLPRPIAPTPPIRRLSVVASPPYISTIRPLTPPCSAPTSGRASTAASPATAGSRKVSKAPAAVDVQKVQAEQKRMYLQMLDGVEDELLERKKTKEDDKMRRGAQFAKKVPLAGKLMQRHHSREMRAAEKIGNLTLDTTRYANDSTFYPSSCFRYHPAVSSEPLRFRPVPDLQDDFYLNVLDWGASNTIAYADPESVHLWNPWSDSELKFSPQGSAPTLSTNSSLRIVPLHRLVRRERRPPPAIRAALDDRWEGVGGVNQSTSYQGREQPASLAAEEPAPRPGGGRIPMRSLRAVNERGADETRRFVAGARPDRTIADVEAPAARPPLQAFRRNATGPPVDSRRQLKVCSVKFHSGGRQVAVGMSNGEVEVWDVGETPKLLCRFAGHGDRVTALAWNGWGVTSGGRDHRIIHRDIREGGGPRRIWTGHEQEVCGLSWSGNEQWLASGGNDNLVNVWDARRSGAGAEKSSLFAFNGHTAAVKALCWNPLDPRMLVTGAGTGDQNLRFVDAALGEILERVFTGAQVCNVLWSRDGDEIVTTHGYALNQVNLWRYPEMEKVGTVSSHMYRVLYLSASPDGEHIVTGAGREGLKLWRIFGRGRRRLEKEEPLVSRAVMC
eukprot:GHVS01069378.1.p1 GENE.GHVS01069378.1~~GHVS01069378.1.p1  ORF type:complete len:709 (+),score=92.82 GHVS01069378.1:130-2127(+)